MGVEKRRITTRDKITSVIIIVHLFIIIAFLLGDLLRNFENTINGKYIVIFISFDFCLALATVQNPIIMKYLIFSFPRPGDEVQRGVVLPFNMLCFQN